MFSESANAHFKYKCFPVSVLLKVYWNTTHCINLILRIEIHNKMGKFITERLGNFIIRFLKIHPFDAKIGI
jgi:hypothetical protein